MKELRHLKNENPSQPLTSITDIFKENMKAKCTCQMKRLEGNAIVLCFEKFYVRIFGYVSIVIFLTHDDIQEALIMGFEGTSESESFLLGSLTNLSNMAIDILNQCGFSEN